MPERLASFTAVLVCQGRAVAHERTASDLFADPTAMPLLRVEEQELVNQVREGAVPEGLGARLSYEMVRAAAELIVARTVVIDAALIDHPAPQVVLLGAGLDGRAWRMPALAGVPVFEVDQPASQRDKRDRAAALPAGRAPHFVAVDLGDPHGPGLAAALAAAGHRAGEPTTWVWEGVVPYLTRSQVTATVAVVAAVSAPGSRLIVNYQAPSVRATVGRRVLGPLMSVAGRRNPWAAEPWRSVWTAASMAAVLGRHGFTVREDHDLLTSATALGLAERRPTSRRNGRVAVADR
jgi:methyltransferase (TIGR00027 family)